MQHPLARQAPQAPAPKIKASSTTRSRTRVNRTRRFLTAGKAERFTAPDRRGCLFAGTKTRTGGECPFPRNRCEAARKPSTCVLRALPEPARVRLGSARDCVKVRLAFGGFKRLLQ